jgi:hypothetical protein
MRCVMSSSRLTQCSLAATWVIVTHLIGCSAETSPGAGDPSADSAGFSFAANVQPLVNQACNCHQSTPILMAPFSLKPGEAYANLVNKPSGEVKTMLLVKPGSLNESYLWLKINGTQAQVGGMGDIMPPNVPLNAQEKMIFEQWIAEGAAP